MSPFILPRAINSSLPHTIMNQFLSTGNYAFAAFTIYGTRVDNSDLIKSICGHKDTESLSFAHNEPRSR